MTQWPEPEGRRLPPEGSYSFRLNREPDLKKATDRKGREYRRLVLYAIALGEDGEFPVVDSFLPWEDRYGDLCKALGVEHGRDIAMEGSTFKADIRHEADREDPNKLYPRIDKIVVPEDGDGPDDDIPF